MRDYLERDVETETGGKFLFTENVEEAVQGILAHLDRKRAALKLAPMLYQNGVAAGDAAASRTLVDYETPRGLDSLGCGNTQMRSQARPPQD